MDRNKQLLALMQTEEERLRVLRAVEQLQRGQQREMPVHTAFLTPGEQAVLAQLLPGTEFWGGYEGAERQVARYLPEYMLPEEDDAIVCLRGILYEKNSLTHRDVLGALMGAGIRREIVGDILVSEDSFDVLVLSDMRNYLMDNLTGAGRQHFRLEQVELSQIRIPEQKKKAVRITVASPRLDSVIAAGFKLSRGNAVEEIRSGKAFLNALLCLKPDRTVEPGDTVSLRGRGKLRVAGTNGTTRKGREALTLELYL